MTGRSQVYTTLRPYMRTGMFTITNMPTFPKSQSARQGASNPRGSYGSTWQEDCNRCNGVTDGAPVGDRPDSSFPTLRHKFSGCPCVRMPTRIVAQARTRRQRGGTSGRSDLHTDRAPYRLSIGIADGMSRAADGPSVRQAHAGRFR